ncbi:MAG: SH3 domain-containing protein [Thermodesulfobacteriota bacterium]
MHLFQCHRGKLFGLIVLFIFLFSTPAVAGERMSIGVSVANIRSGPGQNYEVLWRAEKYTPVEILERDQSGEWCYFKDFEGTKAWVHKNLIRDMDTVIIQTGLCNIRSGPGTDEDLVFQAEKGVPFKVLQRKGKWVQIRHADGDKGWIHQKLVW